MLASEYSVELWSDTRTPSYVWAMTGNVVAALAANCSFEKMEWRFVPLVRYLIDG